MSEELKQALIEIDKLKNKVNKLEGKNENGIPIYSFSKITSQELENIVDIKYNIHKSDIFDKWFINNIKISDENIQFLEKLISRNISLMKLYHEEDLKVNFIIPLLNYIDFFLLDNDIRSFSNERLTYETDKFILNGEADFIFSKGIKKAEKPYFFIQEFKKGVVDRDPEPQLLAELISSIELNNEMSMRGAYIVGATWNFIILEKLGEHKYQYFVSHDFNSTNINDLKDIYKNLLFIKNEIIEMIKIKY
ncbi:MAG: hypothetical protein U9Q30_10520 [Campylobacterota bacterium]|nr:hypothetical protein [Campylobacterota bacterium]